MKYECAIYRQVQDVVRAFVDIEADSEAEALAKLRDMDKSELEFEFWQCAECDPEDAYEINGIYYEDGEGGKINGIYYEDGEGVDEDSPQRN